MDSNRKFKDSIQSNKDTKKKKAAAAALENFKGKKSNKEALVFRVRKCSRQKLWEISTFVYKGSRRKRRDKERCFRENSGDRGYFL